MLVRPLLSGCADECVIPDAGDAVGNGDARQASAVMECVIPMLVTLLGMVMLVRPVQSRNALIPMLVTLDPSYVSAITSAPVPVVG